MRRPLACSLAAMILLTACAIPAIACRCIQPPPPAEALTKASAVLVGKVTALERDNQGVAATIEVDRAWKGVTARTVVVRTNKGTGADCGFPFEMGKSYLVYTNSPQAKEGEQPKLSTNTCTRTCHIDQAADDLKAIGEGKKIEEKK